MDKKMKMTMDLKQEILVKLIRAYYSENFEENTRLIPFKMRPKSEKLEFRCCVHKERAIIADRILSTLGFSIEDTSETELLSNYAKAALDRERPEDKVLTVVTDACKSCPSGRIVVTDLCQGCVARPCEKNCVFGAISVEGGKSVIDQSKCKKCTKCIKVCPYSAIVKVKVPCEDNCPVGAIVKDEEGHAKIDFDKCISCGKCVSSCPFGAIHEKSQIVDVLKAIKSGKKTVAMIAPAVVGQFDANIYKIKTAIKKLGFYDVYEVAQGADITARTEAKDFVEREVCKKGEFMTTSCCASYNELVKKHLKELKPFVSETKTPLYYTSEIVKREIEDCVSVFISPCVAKKKEAMENDNVDYVLTSKELSAFFEALEIDIQCCEEEGFKVEASKEGREFAITCGVAKSVLVASNNDREIKPYYIDGLNKESIRQLKRYAHEGKCDMGNLVEVMSCSGGCVGGNDNLKPISKASKIIKDFGQNSETLK